MNLCILDFYCTWNIWTIFLCIRLFNTLMIRVYRISAISIHKITAFQNKPSIMGYIKFGHSFISKNIFCSWKVTKKCLQWFSHMCKISKCCTFIKLYHNIYENLFLRIQSPRHRHKCIYAIPQKLTLQLFTEVMFMN